MENLLFKDLPLSEEIKKAVADMGFEEATPIQSLSLPHILEGKDVIGQAQTGTGKTCAFGIPAIEMLDPQNDGIQVLVLCPTRELAIQTAEELKNVSKYKPGIKILPVYGGQPIDRQILALKKRPQIIIGTPGRIMDHMRRRTLKLTSLKMLILDEADEMLNMGFREDIDVILEKVPEEKQTIFFSATMPKEIIDLTNSYQKNPIHIKASHKEMTVPQIEQYYLEVRQSSKLEVLSRLLDANSIKLSLIFCNTKKGVDELAGSLQSRGYSAEALHGDMRQEQRDRVMSKFRKGTIDILIATDVAARGIDVDDIEAVFNYDLPNDDEYYVHRIGRTGRAGRKGKAFTFVTGREVHKLRDIQRFIKTSIHLMKPPTLQDMEQSKMGSMLDKVKDVLTQNEYSKYITHVEKILQEASSMGEESNYITTLEVAAALLKMLSEQSGNAISASPIEGIDTVDRNRDRDMDWDRNRSRDRDRNRDRDRDRDRDGDREESFNIDSENEMVRLFINIGRSNNIQPKHIVESIASAARLPGKLIGAIDIFDTFTFVEVPREYAAEVMESMKNYTIKGKQIIVQTSNNKRKFKRRTH